MWTMIWQSWRSRTKKKQLSPQRIQFESLESRHLLAANVSISEFMANNDTAFLDGNGEASDWIELVNRGDESIDLIGWYLTDDPLDLTKWTFPSIQLRADRYMVVFASSPRDESGDLIDNYRDPSRFYHTNFSLRSDGEYLALVMPDGVTIASEFAPEYPSQFSDVSYGYAQSSPGNALGFLSIPTPKQQNGDVGSGAVSDTQFSVTRGFFSEPFTVAISSATADAEIYYTTDGSDPDPTSRIARRYRDEIPIETTTTLRAIAVKEGMLPTNIDTQTYIFLEDVIRQPASVPGFPSRWEGSASRAADYEMDPAITQSPIYSRQILDAMRTHPTVSLVMDIDNWFDRETGIYGNSLTHGDEWERPVSVEFFDFDNGEEIQVNAGIRMQGNASRSASRPKHNMRLAFRDEYGPGRLEFPLFPGTDIDSYNSVVLRGGNGDSWINPGVIQRAQYIRDQWHRDIQVEMGHQTANQGYFHLYINGLYWGLYHLFEQAEDDFMAEHYGGEPEEYDVIKDIRNSGGQVEASSGDLVAWNEMLNRVNQNMALKANYDAVQEYLDVVNLIDYLLINFYTGNGDWDQSNWRAGRRREEGAGFKFFAWDSERTDLNSTANSTVNTDVTGKNNLNYPTNIHTLLSASPEYRMLFADRIQKHMLGDGVLTPERVAETWNARADEIRLALVAESARWGDAHIEPPRTVATWETHLATLNDTYFPIRTDIVINQLANRGLFPDVTAPTMNRLGGKIEAGFELVLDSSEVEASLTTVFVTAGSPVRALVPGDASLEGLWYLPEYNPDGTWTDGSTGLGVGFDNDVEQLLGEVIDTDVTQQWEQNLTSLYTRVEFDVDLDLLPREGFESLLLDIQYNDGFMAFLNGQIVAQSPNIRGGAQKYDKISGRSSSRTDGETLEPVTFDILAFQNLLIDDGEGTNLLAIHGINSSRDDDDLLVAAQLTGTATPPDGPAPAPIYYTLDGSDPRSPGGRIGGLGDTTFAYESPITLDSTTQVNVRVLNGGTWSPLMSGTFVRNEVEPGSVVISEIHYNPAAPTAAELELDETLSRSDFEFIELQNVSLAAVSLHGLEFTSGVDYAFPAVDLAAGERAVVVSNLAAFRLRYGDQINVAGEYADSLSNGGERLRLSNSQGVEVLSFSYDDSQLWPQSADGVGASLELIGESQTISERLELPTSWQGSFQAGGTPGASSSESPGVVINEVLANSSSLNNQGDAIELFNQTASSIDIGGWFLSDAATLLKKYEIPTGTILPGGGFIVFGESDFNASAGDPESGSFALSGVRGDDVWLAIPDATGDFLSIADDVHFDASPDGISLGRYPDGEGTLARLTRMTLAGKNGPPTIGEVVLSEVNYHPSEPSAAALEQYPDMTSADLEFIEVFNASEQTINLTGWRLRGGADYDFDAGVSLAAGAVLTVIPFDPEKTENLDRVAAFRAHYGINETVRLVGGLQGRLNDRYDRIELQRPLTLTEDDGTPLTVALIEDQLNYQNQLPWPLEVDGLGKSLNRRATARPGTEPSSWNSGAPSPGNSDLVIRLAGDANEDGLFDTSDLLSLLAGQKFTTGEPATWEEGDFNGDGLFDDDDLIAALAAGPFNGPR